MPRAHWIAGVLLASAALATPLPAGGADDGIAIHGHWTIEVFLPDGTRVGTYEFDNAYVGASTMAEVLRGEKTPGLWSVNLVSGTGDMPCDDGGYPTACTLVEPQEPLTAPYLFKNLTVSGTTTVVLAGSATCANTSEIDHVQTFLSLCDPTTPTVACTAGSAVGYAGFTAKDLTTPVPVEPGWIVQVTVNLSFS